MKFSILLVAAAVVFTGAHASADPTLNVSINQKDLVLIDAPAVSCQAIDKATLSSEAGSPVQAVADVAAVQFSLNNMTINWTDSRPLTLQWVAFSMNDPQISGGHYQCQIAGTALGHSWVKNYDGVSSITLTPTTPATPANGIVAQQMGCFMSCGSVSLVDPTKSAQISGTVEVYGTYVDTDGTVQQLTTNVPMTWLYQGVGQ